MGLKQNNRVDFVHINKQNKKLFVVVVDEKKLSYRNNNQNKKNDILTLFYK